VKPYGGHGRAGAAVLALRALVLAAPVASASDDEAPAALVLVSIDGLRADYAERFDAPTLERLAAGGVRARALVPVFPSKTFPNHYTLVTGLWPEHHGIVSNTILDAATGDTFRIGDPLLDDSRWWGGEPLWATVQRQGGRAATMFWPGSEAEIGGVRPTYWMPYDASLPGEERVATVLGWLDLPEVERPSLVTLYFSAVDSAGHAHGPFADEVGAALAEVDGHLGALVRGLAERGLEERVDLVVLSDHGMAPLDHDRLIVLDDWIDAERLHVIEASTILGIHVPAREAGSIDALVAELDAVPHLSVWRREAIPERLHLRGHPRTPSVVGLADEGWRIVRRESLERVRSGRPGGAHGYDPALPSMRGVFVARGPSFRAGLVSEPFENVHVYALLCAALGVEPAPGDGSLDAVRHLLRAGR
jgi:predicted AlkP superfamily pyrophosphatase or phosphodiesterase